MQKKLEQTFNSTEPQYQESKDPPASSTKYLISSPTSHTYPSYSQSFIPSGEIIESKGAMSTEIETLPCQPEDPLPEVKPPHSMTKLCGIVTQDLEN